MAFKIDLKWLSKTDLNSTYFGNYDSDSNDCNDYIWSIQIYTCSCYFDHYILWINSRDVRKAIFDNSVNKMQDLVADQKIKSNAEGKNNSTIAFSCGTTICHCCQRCLKDLIYL